MPRIPSELLDLLSTLYDSGPSARLIAERSGLPLGYVDFTGPPKIVWFSILREAQKQHMTDAIIAAAAADYPKINWASVVQVASKADPLEYNLSAPSPVDWHGPTSELQAEKITGNQATFLPLHFLEVGLLRAKAVALIRVPSGAGTGFLLPSNFLLTNNHVIPSLKIAEDAVVVFNNHVLENGTAATPTTRRLDPANGFATSPKNDWTLIKMDGDANSEWGAIPLAPCTVAAGEFVNIIQHPMGGPKVIALYHNVVVFSDQTRLQYLTDTLPGSSGSPVFKSDWSLVGLHRAGGSRKDTASGQVLNYNEGVTVNCLSDDFRSNGISL